MFDLLKSEQVEGGYLLYVSFTPLQILLQEIYGGFHFEISLKNLVDNYRLI